MKFPASLLRRAEDGHDRTENASRGVTMLPSGAENPPRGVERALTGIEKASRGIELPPIVSPAT